MPIDGVDGETVGKTNVLKKHHSRALLKVEIGLVAELSTFRN